MRPALKYGCAGMALAAGAGILTQRVLERTLVVVTVRGTSMEPTFHEGDRVLIHRTTALRKGRIVVVERPDPASDMADSEARWTADPLRPAQRLASSLRRRGNRQWIIKRVAAAPGDPIPPEIHSVLGGGTQHQVPQGKVLLLGDNQSVSLDSRRIGFVPLERVLGTVRRRLPPLRRP